MRRKAEKSDARPDTAGLDEQRLVSLVAEGDLRAFETLYRRYFPRLIRFLDHMLRQPPLIEEVINDTMLVVWQKAYAYDASSKVSTWIFGIAYRKALKALHFLDEPIECDFDQFSAEDAREPENACMQSQLRHSLSQAVDALAYDQRVAVNLTYYHGLGYGEIAEIMNCPLNTVKTRMFHARRHLKTLLSGVIEKLS